MKAMMTLAVAAVFTAAVGTGPAPAPVDGQQAQQFDHARHSALFTSCSMCHSGVGTVDGAFYPDPSFCASCHNGQMQPRVDWQPPAYVPRADLKFNHAEHPPVDCTSCHQQEGASWMAVETAVVEQCLACHGIEAGHHDAPASPCGQCHMQAPKPATHIGDFPTMHGVEAAAGPETCAGCHVRTDCLECHRPGAATPAPDYHPADMLQQHPVQAWAPLAECSNCHNVGQFCQDCHQNAGLVSGDNRIGAGYHDANPNFSVGHGQAARQSLEACVACHTEADCVRCHFNASPHGPNWAETAEKIRSRNPTSCSVCHVGGIPGG
jgi:hypothetical protein